MYFHGDGARRFEEHNPGIRLDEIGDVRADLRIEPAGGDA